MSIKEFFGFGGYQRPAEGYLSWQHLLFVSSLMLVMVVCAVIIGIAYKNKKSEEKNRVLIVTAILIDSIELLK